MEEQQKEGGKSGWIVLGVIALIAIGAIFFFSQSSTEETPADEVARADATTSRTAPEPAADEAMMEEKATSEKTIVDVAVESGNFNTLVQAVTAAELVDTLSGPGPFTVFAPTDDAFAKVPAETLNALLADKEQLTGVLTYHVVPGKVMATDVVKLDSAPTVQGTEVIITVKEDGTVMVNDATVVTTDIETANGVIHVIDTVLLPQ